MDRPIPPFYCVYLLRSISSPRSLYVGSTPNPLRRLKQHNGLAKGGAVRTARKDKRPWEMVCLITGFQSKIAALQFEWSWQNTHITRHIPKEQRITSYREVEKRTKSGKWIKKIIQSPYSMNDKLANLHLMLRVKSFNRWPLHVRFLAPDVHQKWQKSCKQAWRPIRSSVNISPNMHTAPARLQATSESTKSLPDESAEPLHYTAELSKVAAIDVGYASLTPYLTKTSAALGENTALTCAVCQTELQPKHELLLFCHHQPCNMVSHLICLSNRFLTNGKDYDAVIPIDGECPCCATKLLWSDVVRELSLRTRGSSEIQQILKKPRERKQKATDEPNVANVAGSAIGIDTSTVPSATGLAPPVMSTTANKVAEEEIQDDEDDDSDNDILLYLEEPLDEDAFLETGMSDDSDTEQMPLPRHVETFSKRPAPSMIAFPTIIANSDSEDMEEILL